MSRKTLLRAIALTAGATLAMTAAGCERPSEGKADRSAPPPTRVEIVRPERQTVRRAVGAPGQVQAFETTAIHARISGYVAGWHVNIGSAIKKGQVLAELAVPEMDAEVRQKQAAVELAVARQKQSAAAVKVAEVDVAGAEAKLAEVRAGVNRATADVDRWQSENKRIEALFRERAQTGTLLDETRNKLGSASAALDEVRARVKTAEVALDQSKAALEQARSERVAVAAAIVVAAEDARHAEAMLRYARIEAPYDGVVVRRNADTGQLTKPGLDNVPLFVVARSDVVTVTVDVPETYAPDINAGDPAAIRLQEMNDRVVKGTVTRTSWALDPRSRTLRAEIDVPNGPGTLRPGLYAYVTIVAEEHADVLTVPSTAPVREKGAAYCVVVRDGKALRRPITLGLGDGTRTEILDGLTGDEAVVKANAGSLADGQPVESAVPANPAARGAKP